MSQYHDFQTQYALPLYPMRELCLVRGKGTQVWDDTGKAYLDCAGGHGVANIGHSHDKVVRAICQQAEKMTICPNGFYNDQRSLLFKKLLSFAPPSCKRAFLCNSGTESIEAALKFARASTKKTEVICAMKGFHGRTFGALSATFNPKYREGFEPLLPGFHHVPLNQWDKLEKKINDNTAAILLEIVQGEGGVYLAQAEYLERVQQHCKTSSTLLIIDEVQTGFCRTGKFFACEHFGIEPDLLCLAKSIAGGIPMGAVLCSDRIQLQPGKHGTTFGGNPLACAAALASLEVMQEENLAFKAKEQGDYFLEKLRQLSSPKIREVRGLGLMVGVELKEKSMPYIHKLMREGVLALPAGTMVIRFLPPLPISRNELDQVVEKTAKVLNEEPEKTAQDES